MTRSVVDCRPRWRRPGRRSPSRALRGRRRRAPGDRHRGRRSPSTLSKGTPRRGRHRSPAVAGDLLGCPRRSLTVVEYDDALGKRIMAAMTCSITIIVRPSACRPADQLDHPASSVGLSPAITSSSRRRRGLGRQCPGDLQPLAQPDGQRPGGPRHRRRARTSRSHARFRARLRTRATG